jgi:hypothetical protein
MRNYLAKPTSVGNTENRFNSAHKRINSSELENSADLFLAAAINSNLPAPENIRHERAKDEARRR